MSKMIILRGRPRTTILRAMTIVAFSLSSWHVSLIGAGSNEHRRTLDDRLRIMLNLKRPKEEIYRFF